MPLKTRKMRQLLLLRHAKAAPPNGLEDLDRPLAKDGRIAAGRMADYLAQEQLFPDLALVSSARRTRETWEAVLGKLGPLPVRFESRIYEAPAEHLLAVVGEVEAAMRAVLIVGHNPGLDELAKLLVAYGDRYAFARLGQGFPTAGLAVIGFDSEDWASIKPGLGRLERFVTPDSVPERHPE